jgi:uncharacterized protein YecA (UPF0149 family)
MSNGPFVYRSLRSSCASASRGFASAISARRQSCRPRRQIQKRRCPFESMSKRRKGYPSETRVKRGPRTIRGGEVELVERLGDNDLCPCGSSKRFKNCCRNSGRF